MTFLLLPTQRCYGSTLATLPRRKMQFYIKAANLIQAIFKNRDFLILSEVYSAHANHRFATHATEVCGNTV